jgi:hypothetical protein
LSGLALDGKCFVRVIDEANEEVYRTLARSEVVTAQVNGGPMPAAKRRTMGSGPRVDDKDGAERNSILDRNGAAKTASAQAAKTVPVRTSGTETASTANDPP